MKKTRKKKIEEKKPEKVFKNITGLEWVNIVNSEGNDKVQGKTTTYYKFSDGKMAVVLCNNWKTLISELVDTEEKLDAEEVRLNIAGKIAMEANAAHTAAFLDITKIL